MARTALLSLLPAALIATGGGSSSSRPKVASSRSPRCSASASRFCLAAGSGPPGSSGQLSWSFASPSACRPWAVCFRTCAMERRARLLRDLPALRSGPAGPNARSRARRGVRVHRRRIARDRSAPRDLASAITFAGAAWPVTLIRDAPSTSRGVLLLLAALLLLAVLRAPSRGAGGGRPLWWARGWSSPRSSPSFARRGEGRSSSTGSSGSRTRGTGSRSRLRTCGRRLRRHPVPQGGDDGRTDDQGAPTRLLLARDHARLLPRRSLARGSPTITPAQIDGRDALFDDPLVPPALRTPRAGWSRR